MTTTFKSLICALFVSLLAATSIVPAAAQGTSRGHRYSKRSVESRIQSCERYSDRFKDYVDNRLDKSYFDDTKAEDRLNDQASDLEKALDDLRGDFDRTDSWWETRGRVEKVIVEAGDLDDLLKRRRYPRSIYSNWAPLRKSLNTLADVYQVRRIGPR